MATIKTVVVDVPYAASVFTNGVRQEEMGPYRVTVAFKDEQNNTDFTELRASPVKACWSELNIETACSNSPPTNIFLQQVDYQCTLELLSSGNALPINKFMEAVPYFDSSTGLSYCELRPTCNASYSPPKTAWRSRLTISKGHTRSAQRRRPYLSCRPSPWTCTKCSCRHRSIPCF